MKKVFLLIVLLVVHSKSYCWGFFAHKKINYYAVFLLPPQMLVLYKPNIDYITAHAVDPDMRRNVVAEEGARHYIDIDNYGSYPYPELPRKWSDAVAKYGGPVERIDGRRRHHELRQRTELRPGVSDGNPSDACDLRNESRRYGQRAVRLVEKMRSEK